MIVSGIDVGSLSTKALIMEDGKIRGSSIILTGPDPVEYLCGCKDRAVTSQGYLFLGVPGQPIQVTEGDVQLVGDFFQKAARPGCALAIHLKAGPIPLGVQLDDLAVLAANVHNRDGLWEIVIASSGMTGYLGLGIVGKRNVVSPVSGSSDEFYLVP